MSIPTITGITPKRSRLIYPALFLINVPYTVMLGLAGFGGNEVAGYVAFALCLLGTVASGIVGSKRPAPKTRRGYFVEHLVNGLENALIAAAAFGHLEVVFAVLFIVHIFATGSGVLVALFHLVARRSKRLSSALAKAQVRQMVEQMRKNGDIPADADIPPVYPIFNRN